jgi:hypothetical protein
MKVYSGSFGTKKEGQDVPFPLGLQRSGPIMEIEVAVPSSLAEYLTKNKRPVPQPVRGVALIDSGASGTCVDDRVIRQLGVKPIGVATVITAGGRQERNRYPARFDFRRMKMSFEFSSVMGMNLREQSIMGRELVALIGRDVLSRCIFIYDGINARFTLAI